MFTNQEESTIAQWIEMFPTCTTADELLSKVMDHMNSFSAKMANPTNLQLAKDTLFLQLSKQEGLTITNMANLYFRDWNPESKIMRYFDLD